MTQAITRFDITPSYFKGFLFTWAVNPEIADPSPWQFVVEESAGPSAAWVPVSPVLVNQYWYGESKVRQINQDEVLYFRLRMITPKTEYLSELIQPYGDLGRREYLIARDIMRREVLHSRTLAGTVAAVWLVTTFGPKCTVCRDPVTGAVRNPNCSICMGTGRVPPFNGPYDVWTNFSPTARSLTQPESGEGTVQVREFQVRMIGTPSVKKNDLLIDAARDKRYYIDVVRVDSEVRRIPIIQTLVAKEIPNSDPVYRWNT